MPVSSLSIRNKLVLLFSLLVVIISFFFYIYIPSRIEEQAGRAIIEKTKSIARMTAFSLSSALVFSDIKTMNEELQGAKQNKDVLYIVIQNDSGKTVSEYNLAKAEQYNYTRIDTGTFFSAEKQLYKTSSPIFNNNNIIGTLFIGVSLSDVRDGVRTSKNNIALISFFVFLTGVLAVFGISSLVTFPLRQMVKTVDKISEGDFSHRAVVVSKDEVGHLAESFNRMVENVQTAHEELEQLNQTLEKRVDERTKELRLEINERKRAELALRESEQKLRQSLALQKRLLSSLPTISFITTDFNAIITSFSPGAEQIFGYSADEAIGKSVVILHLPEDAANFPKLIHKQLEGQIGYSGEMILVRKNGERFPAQFITAPIIDADGTVMGLLGVAQDITERRRLEDQLRQAQKMESIGTLAGGIAHDFNNILGIILGYVSSLQRGGDYTKERFEKSAEAINKVITRGAHLVRQLLTFARKTDIQFEPTNVNDVIIELTKMVHETFPKTITASLSLDKNLPFIIADHNQLHQSLLNLCVNARDAMPDGGTLSIATSIVMQDTLHERHPEAQEEFYACIRVSDTGMGMKKETVERIFEPFFTTKEIGKGTGLGLAVVYGIVQSHRGFIDVESVQGSGTTFRMYFPMVPGSVELITQKPEDEKSIPRGMETILVIEDEEMLLDLLVTLFQQFGYTVLTAPDGEEAISIYEKNHSSIHLVVTDLGLPKMSGWQAFQKMKEINPNIKAILATGYIEPHEKNQFLEEGISELVPKPYEPSELLRKIYQTLHPSN